MFTLGLTAYFSVFAVILGIVAAQAVLVASRNMSTTQAVAETCSVSPGPPNYVRNRGKQLARGKIELSRVNAMKKELFM